MLTKTQIDFLVKLKDGGVISDEQQFWCRKYFYTNVSHLMVIKLLDTKRGPYGRKIYFLTKKGHIQSRMFQEYEDEIKKYREQRLR